MRLLTFDDNELFKVGSDLFSNIPSYVILSHVWARINSDEVTFQDVEARLDLSSKPEYRKLTFCRDQAAKEAAEIKHYWIDTCCINKRSETETSEAINSMYRWYNESYKCYVYLPDVSYPTASDKNITIRDDWELAFRKSRWFTRGWTLQELIAPKEVEFFSVDGTFLGNKRTLEHLIHEITSIPKEVLRGSRMPSLYSAKTRLAWAEGRNTTRAEDAAYSMLGLFCVHLPLIYGEGKQEALNRLMDEVRRTSSRGSFGNALETEKHQLVRSRTALSLVTRENLFPFSRDSLFVGREAIMKDVDDELERYKAVSLVGLGGIGKSQIAIEHAYRAQDNDPALQIFWIHVGDIHRAKASYKGIAEALGLSAIGNIENSVFQVVHQHLSTQCRSPWLLVLDNLDDDNVLEEPIDEVQAVTSEQIRAFKRFVNFIPTSPTGKIVITSRNWKASSVLLETLGSQSKSCLISVPPMNEDEALELVTSRIPDSLAEEGRDEAYMLAKDLEFLPLAISQACAYIIQRMMPIADYRVKYQKSEADKTELLRFEMKDLRRDQRPSQAILVTWDVTFQHIRAIHPTSAAMLEIMSMFSNQMVPRGLLEIAVNSNQAFDDVMLPLLQYHLVRERHGRGMYDVHHIVQLATKTFIGDNIMNVRRKALSTLAKYLPPVDFKSFATLALCSPHASELYRLEFATSEECLELASTLVTMSLYWKLVSLFPKSEEAISRASAIRQELLGDEDFLTIQAQARHARVLQDLGRGVESEALARSVVNRCEKLADEDDRNNPDLCQFVGSVYNTLGDALIHLGRYKDAEDELRRCLSWYKVFDESSSVGLSAKMSLTICYLCQSAYQSAEDLCRQVIQDFDNSDDEFDLSQKLSQVTLARIYSATLRLDEAALLFREAQTFFKQIYGSEHNVYFLMELELVLIEARKGRYERVLETTKSLTRNLTRIYGEQHQHSLTALALRAEALRQTGRAEEGIELHLRILKVKRKELGAGHPETLASSQFLASAYFATDRYSQGLKMYEDLIPAANITYGPDHVETCQFTLEYGYALRESGKVDDALQQLEQVQEYAEKYDDLRRRKLRQQLYLLIGQCRFDMEQYEQALMYYDLALNSLPTVLDDEFLEHCNVRWKYAFTLEKMGHDAKSMKMFQDILHEAQSRPDGDGVMIKSKEELAHCLRRQSKYAEAQAMYEELIEADYGWRIDRRLNIKSDLGLTLRFRGLLAEAEASDRKLLQERKELSPNNRNGIYLTMNNLGMTLWQRGSYNEAARWLSQAVEGRSEVLGPTHKETIFCKMNLVEILASQQNWRRSDEVFDEVVKSLGNEFSLQHFRYLAVYRDILRIWMNAERYEKVAALESALVDSFAQCFGAEHEDTLSVFGRIAEALGKVGELQQSKNLFARLYASVALPKVLGAKEMFCFKYATVLVQLSDTETLESFSRTLAEEVKTAFSADSDSYSYPTVILSKALQDQKRHHECLAILHERLLGAAKRGISSPNFTICFQAYLGTAARHWLLAPQTEATIMKYLEELLIVFDPSLDVLTAIRAVGSTLWHHSHPKAVEVFESLLQNQNWLSKHMDEQRFDLRMDVMSSMHPAGKFEQGVALAENLLSEPEFSVDRNAPRTLRLLSDLAMSLADAGRIHEAELYSLEAYEGRRDLLGSSHPHTLISKANYSMILRLCGRYCESKKMIEETLSERQKLTDAEDFGLFNAENHLIAVLLASGQPSEAFKIAQVSWSDDVKKLGPKLRWRMNRKALLAQAKSALGKHLEAKVLAENVMRQRQRLSGAKHIQTISSMYDVASIQLKSRKPKDAERLAGQALALMQAEYGDDYLLSLQLRQVLGRACSDQGRMCRAEHQLRLAFYRQQVILEETHPVLVASLREYVLFLLQCWRRRHTVAVR